MARVTVQDAVEKLVTATSYCRASRSSDGRRKGSAGTEENDKTTVIAPRNRRRSDQQPDSTFANVEQQERKPLNYKPLPLLLKVVVNHKVVPLYLLKA